MLTRLYVDNFKCFVNFEYQPAPVQLILGGNGSGKSTFLEVLVVVRDFVVEGISADKIFAPRFRTRWQDRTQQLFELEISVRGFKYFYQLIIEVASPPSKPQVFSETLFCDDEVLLTFTDGTVSLYNDQSEVSHNYPSDQRRSALGSLGRRLNSVKFNDFLGELEELHCFSLNPFEADPAADNEDIYPEFDLSNFTAWYRHLVQEFPGAQRDLETSLQAALDGFERLSIRSAGENTRTLFAEFKSGLKFSFDELSEGQRCLIYLYTILHFEIKQGKTVVIDEPENFISLAEIQPWLMAVMDAIEEHHGQVLIISHHPEMINQLAPNHGVTFVRDGSGPVRVKEFRPDPNGSLIPSELVARGWDSEKS